MSFMDKLKSLFSGGSGADAHDHSHDGHDHSHDGHGHSHAEEAAAAPAALGTPAPVDPLGTPMPGAGAGAPAGGIDAPPTDDEQR